MKTLTEFKPGFYFPILTVLMSTGLLAYFYVQTQPDLLAFYAIPPALFNRPVPELLLAGFAVLTLLELRLVSISRRKQQRKLVHYQSQVNELLENRKQLNTKAHIYAGHADKLKLFISDKLLEYIEYDEKFLHFKSIASEVRHNGIISYDKIATLLQSRIDQADDSDSESLEQLSDARDSLQYLWDLLDLSTADNIALHIANQVCESEEKLFQLELKDADTALVEKPIFDPQRALIRAISRCFGVAPVGMEDDILQIPEQPNVRIHCRDTAPLLGNENHLVLALENLINNAQHFAGRRNGRRRESEAYIDIDVHQHDNLINFSVYNRGDFIGADTARQLFQLGFSTRRARDHHGKGLGLYFVNEIVKGYDGQVSFSNIENRPDVLSLRMEMQSGEVITDVIEFFDNNGSMQCRKSGEDSATESLQWEFFGHLQSIEVTHQSDQQTHRVEHLGEQLVLNDPSQVRQPRWQLSIRSSKGGSLVVDFVPLNVCGVEFRIQLPSLTARLEGDLLTINEETMQQQVAQLSDQFTPLED